MNHRVKQAGVNIDEVRLKRAEERRKQREKLANLQTCTGGTFPRGGACVHYYNRENTINNATNTRNANMNYDDEAFENMPDNGEEPVSDISEPYKPLPLLFDDYKWPKPLDEILTFAETKHQRDALFLGMVDAIGSTLSPYVRPMYGDRWMYPHIQVFVVALERGLEAGVEGELIGLASLHLYGGSQQPLVDGRCAAPVLRGFLRAVVGPGAA